MSIALTPSQTSLFKDIVKELNNPSISRPNYILTGKSGVGKTALGKQLCKSENYIYISFVREYGTRFLKDVDLLDIDETDFLEFIKNEIAAKDREKVFIIDDLEFIFNYMLKNENIEKFLRNYRRMYYFNTLVLILPDIYFNELSKENIFELSFTDEDRLFMAEYYYIAKSVANDFENGYYF